MHVLGVDIGATKVNLMRIDARGEAVLRRWYAHDSEEGDHWLSAAIRLVREGIEASNCGGGEVGAIGISVAGLVDTQRGVLVDGGLLGVRNVPLRRRFEGAFGLPVMIENDANATLIAALEAYAPPGPETTSMLFALGTGVGGAIGLGSTVLHGSFGYGGELGHMPVAPPGGITCVCGSSGCLELMAGGRSVASRARDAARSGRADGLLSVSGVDGDALTAADVVRAAAAGEDYSLTLLETVGEAVGQAIAAIAPAIDPAVIFISGSFGHAAGPLIIPTIERRLRAQHVYPDARPLPDIRLDARGPDAAAIGAALLAHRTLEQQGAWSDRKEYSGT